jgi:tubulin---tyrosine ligase
VLALFSAVPYSPPAEGETGETVDLTPHLTNTSLQMHRGEQGVLLLDELIGGRILSHYQSQDDDHVKLTTKDIAFIMDQIADILAETFKAALSNPVHFQVSHSFLSVCELTCLSIFAAPLKRL